MRTTPIPIGPWRLDPDRRTLAGPHESHALSKLEASLLQYLAERPGETVATEELLREVWGYAPGVRTRAVASTVLRVRRKLGAAATAIVSVYGEGYRLDAAATRSSPHRLFGRDALAQRLERAVVRHRVVTLFGIGGVGKTRVARDLAQRHDTLWVSMPPSGEFSDVAMEIAREAGLQTDVRLFSQVFATLLDSGATLVVLDAAEACGPWLWEWLRTWPTEQLAVVVTSRHHHGPGHAIRVDPLAGAPAVRLLQQRAHAVRPDEPLDDASAAAIVEAVGGIPLALELAASRLRLLDGPTLAQTLERDLGALGSGAQRVDSMVHEIWHGLPAAAQHVLAVASARPGWSSIDELGAMTGLQLPALLEAMDQLLSRAVLIEEARRFTVFDVVRSVVRELAPDAALRAFVAWAGARALEVVEETNAAMPRAFDRLTAELPTFLAALELPDHGTATARAALAVCVRRHEDQAQDLGRALPVLRAVDVSGLPVGLAVRVLGMRRDMTKAAVRPAALEAVQRAWTLARARGSRDDVAWAWWQVTHLRLLNEGADAAAPECANMLDFLAQGPLEWSNHAACLLMASQVARRQQRMPRAIELAREALSRTPPGAPLAGFILSNLASAEEWMGNAGGVIGLVHDELERTEGTGYNTSTLELGGTLAALTFAVGDPAQAAEVVERYRPLVDELDHRNHRQDWDMIAGHVANPRTTPPTALLALAAEARADRRPGLEARALMFAALRQLLQGDPSAAAAGLDRAIANFEARDLRAQGQLAHAWRALAQHQLGRRPGDRPRLGIPLADAVTDIVDAHLEGRAAPVSPFDHAFLQWTRVAMEQP